MYKRQGIGKGLEGIKLRGEELDEAVRYGAHSLDLCAELHLGQTVGSAHAAAQNSSMSEMPVMISGLTTGM